jgi:hypothetical protein
VSSVCISVLTKIISKISITRRTLCGSVDAMISREFDIDGGNVGKHRMKERESL